MSHDAGVRSGRAVVVAMYAVIVALTALLGLLVGVFGPANLQPVRLYGIVELAPTPLGLALYGGATVAMGLGVLLVAVAVVSRLFAGESG